MATAVINCMNISDQIVITLIIRILRMLKKKLGCDLTLDHHNQISYVKLDLTLHKKNA